MTFKMGSIDKALPHAGFYPDSHFWRCKGKQNFDIFQILLRFSAEKQISSHKNTPWSDVWEWDAMFFWQKTSARLAKVWRYGE